MTRNPGPLYPMSNIRDTLPAGGGGLGVFDSPDALQINRARMEHLDSLQLPLAGKRVLDAGCGVGHLARYFVDRGCQVTCVDARQDNIDSLRSRYPDVTAHVVNVETDSLLALGQFDIVFCYGLLYHLENPVAALRNFSHVCGGILLLETVITDHREPILQLSDEPAETPNQALGGFAGRPSPAFVAMALTRAGFRYVYAPRHPPEHPDFQFKWQNDLAFSRNGHLLRCIFVASRQLQDNAALSLLVEGPEIESSEAVSRQAANPGLTPGARTIPSTESELLEAARDLVFVRPLVPYPGWSFGADWDNPDAAFQMRRRIWEYSREHKLEVPFIFEWHAGLRLNLYLGNDLSRQLYIAGCVEPNQFAFLNQILAPGMVFVDGGANDGLYTLFASRRVGREGIVWAFEPSAREFSRLELNLRLNQTENVKLFRVALADRDGEAELAIADDEHAGHNTLGAFAHDGVDLVRTERIGVRKLDGLVRE